jgi:predicted DNA-binding transcriptional regulator AlpA
MEKNEVDFFISTQEVLDRLKIARSSLYKYIQYGIVPTPKKFGKSIKWRSSQIPNMLPKSEVMKRLDIQKSTLYNYINDGTIPEPIKFGRLSRWPEDVINNLFAA